MQPPPDTSIIVLGLLSVLRSTHQDMSDITVRYRHRSKLTLYSLASLMIRFSYIQPAAALPFSSIPNLSTRTPSDGSSRNSKSSQKQTSLVSKYSQYKILSIPLYIWIVILTALVIAGGVTFFLWSRGKREKEEAALAELERRGVEDDKRKNGIPPDPHIEMDEADQVDESWQQNILGDRNDALPEKEEDQEEYMPAQDEYDSRKRYRYR